jgi:hypothetical protein
MATTSPFSLSISSTRPLGFVLHQVQMSQFRICRPIYTEIMDLSFERDTGAVGNASTVL